MKRFSRSANRRLASRRRSVFPVLISASLTLSCLVQGPAAAQDGTGLSAIGPGLSDAGLSAAGLSAAGLSAAGLSVAGPGATGLSATPSGAAPVPMQPDAASRYERQCVDRLVQLMRIDTLSSQRLPGAAGAGQGVGAPDLAGLLGDAARTVSAIQAHRFELAHRNCMAVDAAGPPLLTPNERFSRVLSLFGARPGGPLRAPPPAAD